MMKRLFFAIILVSNICYGQTSPTIQLPAVIGPSPDVSAIQKYGDYKVSTYTGVPDITMPIYTIKLGDISVPISLSYHAGGIKVDEESSRVGLGWTLNAGGSISRNILGLDDLNAYSMYPNSFDLLGFPEQPVISTLSLPFGGYTYDISGKVGLTVDPSQNNVALDLEPDIFYANLMGNSYRFVLQKNGMSGVFEDPSINMKVQLSITPYNIADTTIASTVGMNCTITLTSADGDVYYFNQFESCSTTDPSAIVPSHITAWYLTKILTPKGNEVDFNYTQALTSNTYSLNHPAAFQYAFPTTGQPINPVPTLIPHHTYRNLILSSITTRDCSAFFNYSNRIDLFGDQRLTSVRVVDSKGALIKRVELVQDYFTANSALGNTLDLSTSAWGGPALDSNWLTKRLKLTGLREISADSQIALAHQFLYNESMLPLKNSTSRDHWGYFNNAANGTNLIPDMTWAFPGLIKVSTPAQYICTSGTNDFGNTNVLYQETPHKYYMHNSGANREIDTNYSRAFMLNEIIYPTGGYTKFSFEQNTYDKKKSFANDNNAASYNYTIKSDSVAFIAGIPGIPAGYSQSFNFSISPADTLPGEGGIALVTLRLNLLKAGSNTSTSTTATVVSLLNSSGASLGQMSFNSYGSLIQNSDGTYSPPLMGGRLPIGNYTIQIQFGGNIVDKNSPYYAVIGTWPSMTDQNIDGVLYKFAGGERIRNVSNFNSNGNLISSINYNYHFTADSNQNGIPEYYSTGKIMERPYYFSGNLSSAPFQLTFNSESNAAVNIGYDSVMVEQNKIRHTDIFNNTCYRANAYKLYYSSPQIQMMPMGLGGAPYFEVDNIGLPLNQLYLDIFFDYKPEGVKSFFDNANGKLLKSIDYLYDSVSGKYSVLKQTENTYTYSGNGIGGVIWADRMIASANGVFYTCLKGLPPIYGVTNYFYPAFRTVAVLPLQSKVKIYSGTDSMVSFTNYAYTVNNQLSQKSITNSKGETIVTYYKYPLDLNNLTANDPLTGGVLALQNRHIISPAIEQYTQKSNATGTLMGTLHATLTSYKVGNSLEDTVWATEFFQPNLGFSPLSVSAGAVVKDVNYRPQIVFNKYDQLGNIIEEHKMNQAKTSYLWDYSNTLPICQVINADSLNIAYTSFEADGTGNWSVPDTSRIRTKGITGNWSYLLKGTNNITKAGLNAAMTYIVSYWSQNGSLNVNGTSAVAGLTVGAWTYYEHVVTNATTIIVSGIATMDELRLFPKGSLMTSYTYFPHFGMTTSCSPTNYITYYSYDGFGRLATVKDLRGNIIKTYNYHYSTQ